MLSVGWWALDGTAEPETMVAFLAYHQAAHGGFDEYARARDLADAVAGMWAALLAAPGAGAVMSMVNATQRGRAHEGRSRIRLLAGGPSR
jgi:hypothetical protein